MKVIRLILGKLILLLNAVFSPKPQQRSDEEQQRINKELESMTLYQFESCPFCVKVRRAAKKMSLPLETIDAKQPDNEQALVNGGGKRKVPCLRIELASGEVTWMYESNDIIQYLEQRFP
ncbi:glutathione S-transferase N-terminal domain-containing protein [Photobacterium sp. DA100]|uniref:glutathione S-transferase N-terminal domain-containing protein n=1 Tax=Photobacterium sp. DA100 TaxID=3027472 RepID=UPI00247A0751|nr:glutathione S-transferase N-terminal domain-containing protein [Photobacterium sp. DA100]WEM40992.1 glutathione S-transferase N-terminal domain-containing protein [Photobacterium sp. DA100]